jgi:hypothetical protein
MGPGGWAGHGSPSPTFQFHVLQLIDGAELTAMRTAAASAAAIKVGLPSLPLLPAFYLNFYLGSCIQSSLCAVHRWQWSRGQEPCARLEGMLQIHRDTHLGKNQSKS